MKNPPRLSNFLPKQKHDKHRTYCKHRYQQPSSPAGPLCSIMLPYKHSRLAYWLRTAPAFQRGGSPHSLPQAWRLTRKTFLSKSRVEQEEDIWSNRCRMIHLHEFLKWCQALFLRSIALEISAAGGSPGCNIGSFVANLWPPPPWDLHGKLDQNRLKQDHDDQHRKQRAMNFGTALVPFFDVSAEHFFRCVGEAISWPTPQVISVPLQPVV